MKLEHRQYQEDAAKAWFADIEPGECSPLIAIPTGAGKSVILCKTIEMYLNKNPHDRITILSHTKKIIKQDYDTLCEFFPDKNIIAIFSAGLKQKNKEQITVGGIQSVVNFPELFKWDNLFIVDEAHTVNHKNSGSYRKLFESCHGTKAGMSATIFRSGHGYIHEGKNRLFDKLSYDLTSIDNFNKLIDDGYLTDLITVKTKTQLDSSNVKVSAGDYNLKDLSKAHDREAITKAAIRDAIYYGKNYKKWLVFAIDIKHAEHITAELNKSGIKSAVLHSRMSDNEDGVLEDFAENDTRALVSVGMITTGFDSPHVDLILMLRPTKSALLHVQMIGRGLRVFAGKKHCLILDYAGNTERLGPINNVIIPKSKESKMKGLIPTKTCPVCSTVTYPSARTCLSCNFRFVFKVKITPETSSADIIKKGWKPPVNVEKWLNVTKVIYRIHKKIGAPDSILVTYYCGLTRVKEWWCLDHGGYAGRKALHQVKYRGYHGEVSTHAVYKDRDKLRKPKRIFVNLTAKYPEILNSQF